MKIGIISDSHDNLGNLSRALRLLREKGAELVLHAGDFVSPFTAEPFRTEGLRLVGVFGNNDGDKLYLRERFSGLGEIYFGPHELELAGRKILLMHEPRGLAAFIASGIYELIVYGHTHRPEIRPGRPLVVNPGECGGWLTGKPTCALVDLSTLSAELFEL